MDMFYLSNNPITTVNGNVPITVKRSSGFTIGAGMKQVPSYASPVSGFGQVQALDSDELKQLDGLNIQGTIRAMYIKGTLAGVIRPDQVGGDIIVMDEQDWLVTKVLEHWGSWCKVVIVLQGDGS